MSSRKTKGPTHDLPSSKRKRKGCEKEGETRVSVAKRNSIDLSEKKPQLKQIATLAVNRFGISALLYLVKASRFMPTDRDQMVCVENSPLVLPASICRGVMVHDVALEVASFIGYHASAAILSSDYADSRLYASVRHFHLLPPSLVETPHIGHHIVRQFWCETYSVILHALGPGTTHFDTLCTVFSEPLTFDKTDKARLTEICNTFGIMCIKGKGRATIQVGEDTMAIALRDYGFLQTLFVLDRHGTKDGGGLTGRLF